jgi:hypothetical protein
MCRSCCSCGGRSKGQIRSCSSGVVGGYCFSVGTRYRRYLRWCMLFERVVVNGVVSLVGLTPSMGASFAREKPVWRHRTYGYTKPPTMGHFLPAVQRRGRTTVWLTQPKVWMRNEGPSLDVRTAVPGQSDPSQQLHAPTCRSIPRRLGPTVQWVIPYRCLHACV